MDFLIESSMPRQREHLDVDGMRDWAKDAEWLKLEVNYIQQGREQDDVGYVDFTATYRQDGEVEKHQEDSCFRRVDGPLARNSSSPELDLCQCRIGRLKLVRQSRRGPHAIRQFQQSLHGDPTPTDRLSPPHGFRIHTV